MSNHAARRHLSVCLQMLPKEEWQQARRDFQFLENEEYDESEKKTDLANAAMQINIKFSSYSLAKQEAAAKQPKRHLQPMRTGNAKKPRVDR